MWSSPSRTARSSSRRPASRRGTTSPAPTCGRSCCRATDKATTCPFKGDASYWTLELDGATHADIVWSYEDPIDSMTAIAGRLAFFDERVDVTIDGEVRERPQTQWTPGFTPAEHP